MCTSFYYTHTMMIWPGKVTKSGEALLHTALFWLSVLPRVKVCGISAKI